MRGIFGRDNGIGRSVQICRDFLQSLPSTTTFLWCSDTNSVDRSIKRFSKLVDFAIELPTKMCMLRIRNI